jgi:hypothetical protein
MANWQRKLNLKPVWKTEREGAPVADLAKAVADKLNKLDPFMTKPFIDAEKDRLIDQFSKYARKGDLATYAGFNAIMNQLYNWADQDYDSDGNIGRPFSQRKKVCWIET